MSQPAVLETCVQPATGLETLRVLLVEDNPHMRRILVTILSGVGFRQIKEAADGDEALTLMRNWPCDLVVLDFKMQPMDGVEFTRRVRDESSPNPYLPIIMMTGHSERSRVEEARDAGVTEFVVKPLTARAILDRLNAVIDRPRPFVKSASYFGPDRRRRCDPVYAGPQRRSNDVVASEFI